MTQLTNGDVSSDVLPALNISILFRNRPIADKITSGAGSGRAARLMLVTPAHPSMPAFAPRPQDLPSKTGFAVFAQSIALYFARPS
jgi:hypothetical protein